MSLHRCCCGNDLEDCLACGPNCSGPGCVTLSSGVRPLPECIDIQFAGFEVFTEWHDDFIPPSFDQKRFFPISTSTSFRLQRTGFDYSSTNLPILIGKEMRDSSTGATETEILDQFGIDVDAGWCTRDFTSFCFFNRVVLSNGSGLQLFRGLDSPPPVFPGNPIVRFPSLQLGPDNEPNNPDISPALFTGPAIVTVPAGGCDPLPTPQLYRKCGANDLIVVDMNNRLPGDPVNVLYQSELYIPVFGDPVGSMVPVTFVANACTESQLLKDCGSQTRLPFDPATRPVDGVTAFFFGAQFVPVEEYSDQAPVPVTWSTLPCPGQTAIAPSGSGGPTKASKSLRTRGRFSSDAELDAMGHSPEQQQQTLKQGGCCDPPRA